MSLTMQVCAIPCLSFPRVSGDEPELIRQGRQAVKFSPRERG